MSDYKGAVRCSPSDLIPVNGNCFANMSDVAQLQSLEASAPSFHRRVVDALKASGKVRGEDVLENATVIRDPRPRKKFGIGARVRDVEKGRKGIIIHASAGYTKKKHTPVHKVADKNGNIWLAKQTNLELIY
jgi:hypothetical protein